MYNNDGKTDVAKEDEKVSVEYQKTQLSYGGYRPGRVIWIKLLNGQRVVKFNLLDRDGNVLFSIEQKSDKIGEIENIITYGTITEEQIKDIQRILTRNEPCYDWYDDDLEGTLEYFGNEIVRLNDLMRFTKKYNDILVNYNIYSSDEEDEESESDDLCDLDFYEVGSITREVIENNLVQKLLEHQEWDTIEMKIIENGQMDSYLLEFEERKE